MEPSNQLATMESNATAIYQRMSDPMVAIKEMGQMFAASGMFGCTKVEQGQVLALACLIEGKSPFELMRNYHIIGGNLSMRASAILAQFQAKGGKCTWYSALNDVEEARATFSINGTELIEATYTIEDAKREKLVGGTNPNWTTRPADMLRARLITKAVRMIAPGIVMGIMDETETAAAPAPLLGANNPPGNGPVEGLAGEATVQPDDFETMLANGGLSVEETIDFCIYRKMLAEGETLENLSKVNRNKIRKNFTEFAQRIIERRKEGDGAQS